MRSLRCGALAAVLLALAVASPSARAQSATALGEATCPDVSVTTREFADAGLPGVGWVENLGFDGHGGMWASEIDENTLVRFDAAGQITASLSLSSPGAVLPGPGAEMYAVIGDSDASSVTTDGGVVTFPATLADPTTTTIASGLGMTNGAAFDSAGNLYLTDGSNIDRLSPGGTLDTTWGPGQDLSGNDGLAVSGNDLYATILTSANSQIVRINLATGTRSTAAELSGSAGEPLNPLAPDDLTVGPDRELYVATALGDLIRVNPTTGSSCLLYSGPPLTTARFATAFPPYTGADLFVASELGEITDVHLSPAPAAAAAAPTVTPTPVRRRRATKHLRPHRPRRH